MRRIRVDDGQARLERQQRATRLRTWVDGDGMWCLAGRFDPQAGVILHRRLVNAVEARFAERVPDLAPDDPGERTDFLRAHRGWQLELTPDRTLTVTYPDATTITTRPPMRT